jgi:hypothetical protein
MKKKVSIVIATGLIIIIFYLMGTRSKPMRTKTDFHKNNSSKTQIEQGKYKKIDSDIVSDSKNKEVTQIHETQLNPEQLSEEEIEEFEEYFEAVEKNWIIQIESLFIGEFSLTEDKIENYLDIREGYEEEKMIAFQEFHEYMIQKHGENYTFTPTPDMEQFENKVVQTYKEKMEQFLGENNYVRYKEVLEEYNNRLRREQDPDKGVILIEL